MQQSESQPVGPAGGTTTDGEWHLYTDGDLRHAGLMIGILSVFFYITAFNDWLLLKGTPWLLPTMGLKPLHALVAGPCLLRLWRSRDAKRRTACVTVALLATVVALALTLPSRLTHTIVQAPAIGYAIAVIMVYLVMPVPLRLRRMAGLGMTVPYLLLIWWFGTALNPVARLTTTVSFVAVNVMGYMAAHRLVGERQRRVAAEGQWRQSQADLERHLVELAEEKERAEGLARARTDFIATMSHEFRTPMNAVIGLSDMLRLAPLTAEHRRFVEQIHDSSQALMLLLNEILEFAKYDAGHLELLPQAVDLQRLSAAVVDLMVPAAGQRGVTLNLEAPADLPAWVLVDGPRLRQVLVNLMANAVKATARGTVTLRLTAPPPEAGECHLTVAVQDTGSGMDAQVLSRLFQPFVQGESGRGRPSSGTGLGLVISRQIVRAMGSDIAVASTPGEGSVFSFTLRLPVTDPPQGAATNDRLPPTDGVTRTVLVVDDEPVNRLVVTELLRKLGHQVEAVADGTEAIAAARRQVFDLVLMDLRMPGMDGVETTRLLLEGGDGRPRPKVVALSASAFPEDIAACRAAGMCDFASKPVDIRSLAALIERVFGEALVTGPTADTPGLPLS